MSYNPFRDNQGQFGWLGSHFGPAGATVITQPQYEVQPKSTGPSRPMPTETPPAPGGNYTFDGAPIYQLPKYLFDQIGATVGGATGTVVDAVKKATSYASQIPQSAYDYVRTSIPMKTRKRWRRWYYKKRRDWRSYNRGLVYGGDTPYNRAADAFFRHAASTSGGLGYWPTMIYNLASLARDKHPYRFKRYYKRRQPDGRLRTLRLY